MKALSTRMKAGTELITFFAATASVVKLHESRADRRSSGARRIRHARVALSPPAYAHTRSGAIVNRRGLERSIENDSANRSAVTTSVSFVLQ